MVVLPLAFKSLPLKLYHVILAPPIRNIFQSVDIKKSFLKTDPASIIQHLIKLIFFCLIVTFVSVTQYMKFYLVTKYC